MDNFDEAEDTDEQYGHLTAHLVEPEAVATQNYQWSRVFTRDDVQELQIAVHALGPDLIYDKALREAV